MIPWNVHWDIDVKLVVPDLSLVLQGNIKMNEDNINVRSVLKDSTVLLVVL
jgi:hypothetical protein